MSSYLCINTLVETRFLSLFTGFVLRFNVILALSFGMSRTRPLLFTYDFREKSFRGRHWYVSGFAGERRVQLWFRSEKEAKAAVANRNAEIKAHGTQVSLSPKDRLEAIAAAERLAPYGKSISEAVAFYVAHLDRLASSIAVRALCQRVGAEFERRLAAGEISAPHALNMRETLRKFAARFGDTPVKLLDGAEIKGWLAALPLAVKTRNRHLGYVRNILGLAREWNLLQLKLLAGHKGARFPGRYTVRI